MKLVDGSLDQQTCELRFGSWTYNQRQLNFTYYDEKERRVTIKDYVVSGSWDLMDGPMSIHHSNNETNESFGNSYRHDRVEFVCKLLIRRKTLFYTVNLIIPTVNKGQETKSNFSIILGFNFISVDLRFLFTDRRRRKNDFVNLYSFGSSRFSTIDFKNITTDVDSYSTDRQISPVYIHDEYSNNILYGGHYQLQLSNATNQQNALLDASIIHRYFTSNPLDGETEQSQ